MNRILRVTAAATAIWLLTVATSEACYCGAVRHRSCCYSSCAIPCCEYQTVMKTCTRTIYESEQYTAYRTCCVPVCEQKVVESVRYVPETHYRTCTQTVCRPVYNTTMTTVAYDVCRPVYETKTRQVQVTVCRPIYETAEREECYTVCRPVTYKQKVQVCAGHWETRRRRATPALRRTCAPCRRAPGAAVPRVGTGDAGERSGVHEVRARDIGSQGALHDLQIGARSANPQLHLHCLPHGS